MKIGFIGLGNMATAMIGGMIRNGVVPADDIIGSGRSQASLERAADTFKIKTWCDNGKVAAESDILFLSVKPQMYEEVIAQIKDVVKADAVIVSIAPGKTMAWLAGLFGRELAIVRCMPNTPALVGEGCTGVCHNTRVTDKQMKQIMVLLNSFGKAFEVPEHLMDAVVGVSGSSPAYVFLFIEAMADAAVSDGMPRAQAYEFAAQAVYGSAKMVLETGKHPAELKDMVCSPAGTTIEAVTVLEQRGFRSAVIEAQKACVAKSKNM